jgi:hypothetical protein
MSLKFTKMVWMLTVNAVFVKNLKIINYYVAKCFKICFNAQQFLFNKKIFRGRIIPYLSGFKTLNTLTRTSDNLGDEIVVTADSYRSKLENEVGRLPDGRNWRALKTNKSISGLLLSIRNRFCKSSENRLTYIFLRHCSKNVSIF